ncbi:hypothetical protein [Carboxylicivirga marina]|uniref:O-antigen polysaccharide polymerase Wzy n=1 Tax=Carboxylicivirga marina TaxID=2800988 RepID=A0ABS1HJ85_9BACT|nr:hypothetical protein [Carboxylicivirga marina]MBK3517670.1 hypothetical protein [Carboxylicivirga marina]
MVKQYQNTIFILIAVVIICSTLVDIPLVGLLSLGSFSFSLFLFIDRLGKTIPLLELAFLTANLQLLASSFLAFYIQEPDKIFSPKLDAESYFNYALPGILLFGLGLFTFKSNINSKEIKNKLLQFDLFSFAKQLVGIGYLAIIIQPFVPGALAYFFTLLVFLSYIGGIIVIFSQAEHNRKVLWLVIAFLPVLRDAFFSGVFFLALVWVAFAFLYYMNNKPNLSFNKKLAWVAIGIYLIVTLDGAKKDYREVVWKDTYQQIGFFERAGLLAQLSFERLTFQNLMDDQNLSARITRANQGALVTWVMDWVPENEDYANGETIKSAIISAIFPRILLPNKAKAGGKENFERFTGHKLKGTSMNLSLLGEGWANYGYWGGLVFMYCVGFFYSYCLKRFSKFINRYPPYFFFIPFLFIYIIKAEDDLLTPLNHFFKALIVFIALHQVYFKKYFSKNRLF